MGTVMTDPLSTPEPPDESGAPRWVKVLGGIALALVVVILVVHLAGGGMGGHTP
ncbi:hypothetical protein SPRI_6523 [Streptomyces pristinaespiralis]|jgi:hypothetical protein|nr:hypothetical protein SPRI_6523 [Streptomyces pristinaespiralis]